MLAVAVEARNVFANLKKPLVVVTSSF